MGDMSVEHHNVNYIGNPDGRQNVATSLKAAYDMTFMQPLILCCTILCYWRCGPCECVKKSEIAMDGKNDGRIHNTTVRPHGHQKQAPRTASAPKMDPKGCKLDTSEAKSEPRENYDIEWTQPARVQIGPQRRNGR